MPDRLVGKIALVTGANNGIGRGCAEIFAREGATVLRVDREQCDLTDEAEVSAFMERVQSEQGRIDILVNAAASATFKWIEEMDYADWRATITGELDIVFLVVRAAWPMLRQSGSASVINFASANARHALEGSAALAHCAGKGGVLAMTRQLAMEGAPHNIRVNCISPGFIKSAATAAHLASDPGIEAHILSRNMITRLGEPEDVAWCATWLASDEASYVTGGDFPVDAGATAW